MVAFKSYITKLGDNMNVKIKFVGKVNHVVDSIVFEPGKSYTIDSELAKHPFFEIQETPKAKVEKPKAEPKADKPRPKKD